jgi:transcriptional regulator with XRE-family HTH domain
MVSNKHLAEFVGRVMRENGLSTYDVARRSNGGISQSTVNKILNRDVRSHSIETLSGLAKGLGVSDDQIFRVVRGLSPESPTDRIELLAESFNANDLTPAEWKEIETVVNILIEQKKALRTSTAHGSPAFRRGKK